MKRRLWVALSVSFLAAGPLLAEDPPQTATGEKKGEKEEPVRRHEEVTVVSASKVDTALVDAPATMSVVTEETLATSPAQNYADLLRGVPGLNVIQTSARDINLTSRQATATLSSGELVLVDGRSVYLDFYGLVLWDFIPTPGSNEIKQIEVVRGPDSVVWGANALNGVVNIITKSPREAEGFGVTLGAGLFSRDGGSRAADGRGYNYNGSFSYAAAPNQTWSYKLTAGYTNSDPYSRPIGTVPLGEHPLDPSIKTGGAPYPPDNPNDPRGWVNRGTSQPKADVRVDQELSNGGRITYQGGYAGTKGIIHSGIGPFDIESGSHMAYGRVYYTKGPLKVSGFGNFVNAKAPNLLQTDPGTLQPVRLDFKNQTYDFEVGNTNVVGGKHILTYGGNARRDNFDITLAPNGRNRNEFGAYFQEEFYVSKFRLAAGARVDKFGNIDHAVLSPRVSVMFKPTPRQSIRVSYNRAFRSPSVINNYLDQDIFSPTPVDLSALKPFLPPSLRPLVPSEPFYLILNTFGSTLNTAVTTSLKEEHIDAFELAYTGTIAGKTTVGISLYRNDQDNNINFVYLTPDAEHPQGLPGLELYSARDPAQGVTVSGQRLTDPLTGNPGLSPILMSILGSIPAQLGGPILLPWKVATYLNLGPLRNQGIELSIDHRVSSSVDLFANYSWQDTPKVLAAASGQIPYSLGEITLPPKNRFNAGLNVNVRRFLGNLSVNYADKAFWNDVLNEPYWGSTKAYTMVNATFGMKFADGKVTASLRGTNLFNQQIQQHIYGDILRRAVMAELRVFTK
jgi:outer membrane receptor protein involved in Fe transport